MGKCNKKLLTTSVFIFSLIAIGLIVFFGTYYFFIHASEKVYENKIKLEISTINNVNENTSIFTKGQTININSIISNIPNHISRLQTSETNLKEIIVPKKYKKSNNHLLLGVKNNINIYRNILSISKDPKNPNLNNLLVQLEKNKDNCINYYCLVSLKGIKIMLANESIELINNSITYTKTQIGLNINEEISSSQNIDFLKIFDPMINKFDKIRKDYTLDISKAKNTPNGYENMFNCIKNVNFTIDQIKSVSSKLSVPEDTIYIYQSFTKLLDDYETYIRNINFLLKSEQLTPISNFSDDDSINKLYISSEKEIKIIDNNYKEFMKIYNNFKKKYNFELFF